MADRNPKIDQPWSAPRSQLILVVAGAVAWVVATALAATETSQATAGTFAVAGLALIGAAAFYARIRKLGPTGVEVDPVEVIRGFRKAEPPVPDGVSTEAIRDSLLEAVEGVFVRGAAPEAEADRVITYNYDAAVERTFSNYERAINLELAAREWIEGEEFAIVEAKDAGVDYLARHAQDVRAIEVRSSGLGAGYPTPEQLRDPFLRARVWTDEHLDARGSFERVLASDDVPPPALRKRFEDQGIGIYLLEDDEPGQGAWLLRPNDARG